MTDHGTDEDVDREAGPPAPPEHLEEAGRRLWTVMHDDLEAVADELDRDMDFTMKELALLDQACRVADTIEELQRVKKRIGQTMAGSTGQRRLSPVYAELRQQQLTLSKLLNELSVKAVEGVAMTPAQDRARRAAHTRWGTEAPQIPGQRDIFDVIRGGRSDAP